MQDCGQLLGSPDPAQLSASLMAALRKSAFTRGTAKSADSWSIAPGPQNQYLGIFRGSLLPVRLMFSECENKYLEGVPEWCLCLLESVTLHTSPHVVRLGALYRNKHQELRRLMNQVNSNPSKSIFSTYHVCYC